MLTEFKPTHRGTYNCLEDVLECLATGYEREHLLMFMKAWDFNFFLKSLKGDKRLGTRVESGEYNAWESLKAYHGIGSKCLFTSNRQKQRDNLIVELQARRPVVLWLDGYYVPWTNIYKQLHMKHFIIAIGIDEMGQIEIIDPYWNKKVNKLSMEAFDQSTAKCINIKCLEEPHIIWQDILKSHIEHIMIRPYNAFESMRQFAQAIKTLDLTIEIAGFEELPYNCPFFMQLAEVFFKRLNYSKCLIYMGERFEEKRLVMYGEEMEKIGKIWQNTREQFADVYKGKCNTDIYSQIADTICLLADQEETLAKKILILCK